MTEENNTPDPVETPARAEKTGPAWGRITAWGGLLVLLALVGFGLVRAQRGPVRVGDQAPDFTLTTYDGDEISLESLRGKVVVLNFWASWCKPCEQEAADMEAAWQYYQPSGEVIFLGVAYTDTPTESRKYLAKFGITYPNGDDLGTRISQAYRIRGVPETYIIGRDGVIVSTQIGPYRSLADIQRAVEQALAAPAP